MAIDKIDIDLTQEPQIFKVSLGGLAQEIILFPESTEKNLFTLTDLEDFKRVISDLDPNTSILINFKKA